jgi:hypothetical protein
VAPAPIPPALCPNSWLSIAAASGSALCLPSAFPAVAGMPPPAILPASVTSVAVDVNGVPIPVPAAPVLPPSPPPAFVPPPPPIVAAAPPLIGPR